MQERWAWIAAFAAGAGVCGMLTLITGQREAWDSPLYFSLGLPLLAGLAALFSARLPARSWRWAFGILLGQTFMIFAGSASLGLFPLTLLLSATLCAPLFVICWIVSKLRARKG
ncbi:MAG: hypothetical protein H6830_09190 [Planctomycetes bacterium]|nr:hypothetical protein [Planctomycetota bacterium]MCB9909897.1 hypothetical protein [Planctomycetota bacterium]MCB9912966.1 hypothetical protein [Planctomycetota bacterium]HPF15615.1 hypothetical protein [Planctomycetota bacterium]HRV80276.1 hypothetical protein [Planctomycetota bacterium]